jgi:hypothetical protein
VYQIIIWLEGYLLAVFGYPGCRVPHTVHYKICFFLCHTTCGHGCCSSIEVSSNSQRLNIFRGFLVKVHGEVFSQFFVH